MDADGFEFVLAGGDEGHVAAVDDGDPAAVGGVQGEEFLRRRDRRVDRNDARAFQFRDANFADIDRVRADDAGASRCAGAAVRHLHGTSPSSRRSGPLRQPM